MRKIFTISFCLLAWSMIQAQITLNYSTHSFRLGDSHDFIFMIETSEGASGENVNWDFTKLQPNNIKLTSKMLSPASFDSSSNVPQANLVLEEFGNHFYFKVSSTGMEQYGTMSGKVLTIYDQPILKLKYPFTYGDDVTGSYSGTQQVNNSNVKVSGTYEVTGDAYGTLLLPNNVVINNVLRVKQVHTLNINGTTLNEITYRWYSANVRYPILVIIKYITPEKSYIAETAMYAHVGEQNQTKAATDIASVQAISNVEAYPNPYEDNLTISYTLQNAGKVSVEIYDASGRLMKSVLKPTIQEKGFQSLVIDTKENGFTPGNYFVKIKMNDNVVTKEVIKINTH